MSADKKPANQGERMLWVLGGAVCIMAVAFFALLNMGGSDSPTLERTVSSPSAPATPEAAPESAASSTAENDFSVQLNRARLALDAGMLIEPDGFSAWSIYSNILATDAGNAAAQAGLTAVADSLADQAHSEFNSGRRDEARALAQRVIGRFPAHADALAVLERIDQALIAATTPRPVSEPPQRVAPPAPQAPAEPAATQTAPAQPPANPLASVYGDFTRALAENRLRAPDSSNALTHYFALRETDAEHAMTIDAGQQLLDAMFEQHNAAFNALDTSAAIEWLDLAASLDVDAARVTAAREQFLDLLAAQSAQESLSASEFTLRNYVAPVYPTPALRRELEGWVDVAFVLSREGRPTDVEVLDASNSVFREAATRAVEAWEFEPHSAWDRVVEQQAHTRIRFVLED